MQRLKGKTTIVTGAGQGIGEAIARRFATEGAHVVIAELNEDKGRDAAEQIASETGAETLFVKTDISKTQSVTAMHAAVLERFGPVDVLVNNAGIAVFRSPLETSDDDWDLCMNVDLKGAWTCTKTVLPDMLAKQNGAVINIISNHAFSIIKGTFPYPVAKHGLLGLTRSLALEYADKGIAINAISPGYTDTQIAENDFAATGDAAKARAKVEAMQPVGRLCRPDEIAAVAAMLASEEARFMIGENIVMDGGVTIRMYDDIRSGD
ncbi:MULTISPECIES: SDR family oxidoreductase [Halocynthiibacter]|uniref:SDR family oxidoreductase n=1 Tax=Halocynthiibacter halioticoli TaxID=2986804 RepID=A0AAE3IVY4_9RHOB|nr:MULTISPECIES: SDR family oxidoreductase [Halocynthiibacter]MCV6822984.1 SDR family oxidoreductase [Halocynthiibacter halioticoli]MCW4055985.1 SDR family oxidoreductase [Halocynthiibacter sp. SDUM655004]